MGGNNPELQELTDRLVDQAGVYGMEVGTKNSKALVNSAKNIITDISIKNQKLEEVELSF